MKIEQITSPATRTVLYRALTAHVLAEERKCDIASAVKASYPDQSAVMIAALNLPGFISKATTNPAMTSVSGWAAELTHRKVVGPIAALTAPVSAFSKLAERGAAISLEGVGSVAIPRHPPGVIAGIFVGEGAPIPVVQLTGTPGTALPYKVGAIIHLTGELAKYGIASIEQLLQQALANDIALSIDAALFSSNAATSSSPAGLLASVAETPHATAPSPSEAFAADLGNLAAAIQYPTALTYVVSASDYPRTLVYTGGETDSIISSAALPARQMVAIDANDFYAAEDAANLDISVSKSATLVSRTDPVPVVAAGGTRGAPTVGAFQMDLIAVRVLSDLTFGVARSGRVAWTSGVVW